LIQTLHIVVIHFRMTSEEFKIQVLPWARRLYPMIRRLLKSDAETQDAVQNLMMKLWEKKDSLHKLDNMDAYIMRMAKNYCLDVIKRKKPEYWDGDEHLRLINLPGRDENFECHEKVDYVRKVIDGLPEKYKQVIQYRDIDGFEFEEIMELTGYEIPYIRVILSRARVMVKTEVQKIYSYEKGTNSEASGQIL